MASVIRVLSDQTINQIAAGEVIENPASVIKELVENSIDAGANKIQIDVIGGGFQSIKVQDNGRGMSRDDAVLCLERHATSKLSNIDDFNSILSMGFRGEAIASIASIAKCEIATCLKGEKEGTKVVCHGGKILSVNPHAPTEGTIIEIKSLFYNVPARKKFQKSAAASQAEITKTLTRMALGFPHVQFILTSNNKEIFATSRSSDQELIDQLKSHANAFFGSEFINQCKRIDFQQNGFNLKGFIGLPSFSRKTKVSQYLYINNRFVISTFFSRCVHNAYGFALDAKDYPIFLLHLSLPPSLVDVNVHPQKREVRFKDEWFIESNVKEAIDQALGKQVCAGWESVSFQTPIQIERSQKEVNKESRATFPSFAKESEAKEKVRHGTYHYDFLEEEKQPQLSFDITILFLYKYYIFLSREDFQGLFPKLHMQREEGIVVVNMKYLQQSLLFHQLLSSSRSLDRQQLLFPIEVQLDLNYVEVLLSHQKQLNSLGFSINKNSESSIEVLEMSNYLDEKKLQSCLENLAEDFMQNITTNFWEKIIGDFVPYLSQNSWNKEKAQKVLQEYAKKNYGVYSPSNKPLFLHLDETRFDSIFSAHQKSVQSSC